VSRYVAGAVSAMTLLSCTIAFLACDLLAVAGLPPWLGIFVAAPAVWLLPAERRRRRLAHATLALGVVALATWYLPAHTAAPPVGEIAGLAGQQVRLRVRAAGDGDAHPTYIAVTADVLARDERTGSSRLGGRLRLLLPPRDVVHDGDQWLIAGIVEGRPDGGGYAAWLRQNGIDGSMAPRLAQLMRRATAPPWTRLWRFLHERTTHGLEASLPAREAALAETLVYGGRHSLPTALQADLDATGMSHLATVSAFNLILLYGLLVAALAPLIGRRFAVLIALALAIWYGASVGLRAPVLRGEVLLGWLALASLSGRPWSSLIALTDAAAVLLLPQPGLLRDAAFELTFTAAAALALLAPALNRGLRSVADTDEARAAPGASARALVASTAVALASLPVLVLQFGTVSPYAALANALVNPLLPAMTLLALVAGLGGAAAAWLAPLAAPLWLLIELTERIVHLFASLPFSGSKSSVAAVAVSCGSCFAILGGLSWLRSRSATAPAGNGRAARPLLRRFVQGWLAYPLLGAAVLVAFLLPGVPPLQGHADQAQGTSVTVLPSGGATALLVTGANGTRLLLSDSDAPGALAFALEDALPPGVPLTAAIPLDRRPETVQALRAVAGNALLCPFVQADRACAALTPDTAAGAPFEIAIGGSDALVVAADGGYTPVVTLRAAGQTILLAGQPALVSNNSSTAGAPHADVVLLPGWSRSSAHRWLTRLSPGAVVLMGAWPPEAVRSLQALLPAAAVTHAGDGEVLRFATAPGRNAAPSPAVEPAGTGAEAR